MDKAVAQRIGGATLKVVERHSSAAQAKEAKLKDLELIQGVVNRLATDSFRLKGWAVVLVSAILFLLAREGDTGFAYVGLIPAVVFRGLDGTAGWSTGCAGRDAGDRMVLAILNAWPSGALERQARILARVTPPGCRDRIN